VIRTSPVATADDLTGAIRTSNDHPLINSLVQVVEINKKDSSTTILGSSATDDSGAYHINGNYAGHAIRVTPNPTLFPDELTTYSFDEVIIDSASNYQSQCRPLNLRTLAREHGVVPGIISGNIVQRVGSLMSPVPALRLVLMTPKLEPVAQTITDTTGAFSFTDIEPGSYRVFVDRPIFRNKSAPTITLPQSPALLEKLSFELFLNILIRRTVADVEMPELSPIATLSIHPNPSSGAVAIWYATDRPGLASITIYNLLGMQVAVIARRSFDVGVHEISVDPHELALPPGTYFVVANAHGSNTVERLILTEN
jgi:hypothetical protein